MQLTVACVQVGNYYGRGADYVRRLQAAVQRHLRVPHRFVCVTDDAAALPGIECIDHELALGTGWWQKIALFRPGRFEGRVLYLDLDTVIIRSIDALAACKGIIHLAHWGWKKNDYGSGVMVWDAGEHDAVWNCFGDDVPQHFRGDQDWLTHLGGWDALPFPLLCSAKYHCQPDPPRGAAVVCFHGPKKPHNDPRAWVSEAWAA